MVRIIKYAEHRRVRIGYDERSGALVTIEWDGEAVFSFYTALLQYDLDGVSGPNNENQMTSAKADKRIGAQQVQLVSTDIAASEHNGTAQFKLVRKHEDGWLEEQVFQILEEEISLQVKLINIGEQPRKLRAVKWITSGLGKQQLAGCEVLMPGYSPEPQHPYHLFKRLNEYPSPTQFASEGPTPYGADEPGNRSGIIGVFNAAKQSSSLTWWINDNLPMKSRLLRLEQEAARESTLYAPCNIAPGESIELGSFYFAHYLGNRLHSIKQAMNSFSAYRFAGEQPPEPRSICIYEVQLGEKRKRSVFSNYEEVLAKLSDIKKLGFNTLEIMPKFPFPSYSVYDFFNLDVLFGSKEGLKRLIQAAHEMDMRVIIDIVFHGPLEEEPLGWKMSPGNYNFDSPYLEQRPDWFSIHENGEFARTYTRAFDLANPELQEHIAEAMLYSVQELNVDGFRLDAQTWNFFPNWSGQINRPAYASLYAGYHMITDISTKLTEAYPSKILYTEGCGPLVSRYHPYRYNYDYHWIYPGLGQVIDPRGMSDKFWYKQSEKTLQWRELAQWLEEADATLPEGIHVVHHADSHDSHEWAGFDYGQFNREAFGLAEHRVMVGMAAFMNGGFMSFVGAEEGNESYYSKLLGIRNQHFVMQQGRCSYRGIIAEDLRIITIVWISGRNWLLYAANPDGQRKQTTIRFSVQEAQKLVNGVKSDAEWEVRELLKERVKDPTQLKLKGKELHLGWELQLDNNEVQIWEGTLL